MTDVAIIGLGLMGGSLGMALRRTGRFRVFGVSRRAATVRTARRRGAIDAGSTRLADAAGAAIVVLGMPVGDMPRVARKLFPSLRPGTIVTDLGSVKGPVLKALAPLARRRDLRLVGSHPLAGSHRTGIASARGDLFRGSVCVVVPGEKTALRAVGALWRAVGARPVRLSAEAHDAALALTSHLPHLLAHALVQSVLSRKDCRALGRLMAGSFRDMTRVASADPRQWSQIFSLNARPLRQALARFGRELERLARGVGRPGLERRLRRSQAFRQRLFDGV